MGRRIPDRWLLVVALPSPLALSGCARTDPPPPPEVRAGRPDLGAAALARRWPR